MGQITLYLDEDTKARVKRAARAARKSQSQWLAELVREKTEQGWPDALKKLLGSCPAFPSAEQIRSKRGKDVTRAKL